MAHVIDNFGNILSSGTVIGLQSVQVFTANGTWTKPNGCNKIIVEVVGGGGGGGSSVGAGSGVAEGGGGGGGGYSCEVIDISAVSSVAVTVGGGGAGGSSGGVNTGATGGTSSFGAYCSATGGTGGAGSTATTGNAFAVAGVGGSGSGGDINVSGGDGCNGRTLSGIVVTLQGGGAAGGGSLGGGFTRSEGSSLDGVAGKLYGGGGEGAQSTTVSRSGGDGADGIVVVWEFGQTNIGSGSPHNLLDGLVNQDTVAAICSRGSLIYGNSTPEWDELVLGSTGYVLASDGTDAAWRGGMTLLNTATASNSATIDFTLPSGYNEFAVEISYLLPATNSVNFIMRVSTDGGSTFLSGASDYAWAFALQGGSLAGTRDTADTAINFSNSAVYLLGNTTTLTNIMTCRIMDHANTSAYTTVYGAGTMQGGVSVLMAGGAYLANTAVNAIRFAMSSGDIATGVFKLYGMN